MFSCESGRFRRMLLSGYWEKKTLRKLASILPGSCGFIDVGAWIGPMSLFAASFGVNVLAFEPDPLSANLMRESLKLNPKLWQRIKLSRSFVSSGQLSGYVAPWKDPRIQRMFFRMKPQLGKGMSIIEQEPSPESIRVPGEPLLPFLDKHPMADILKIDIEGGEHKLLADTAEGIAARANRGKNRMRMVISLHGPYAEMLPTLNILQSHCREVTGIGGEPLPLNPRQMREGIWCVW